MRFLEYITLREFSEKGVPSEIKLSDDSDFKPFIVGEDGRHPNLSKLISAFLDSSNVPLPGPDGVSKLVTLDAKGETSPKLKKKMLYATGGTVRDHARGKTSRDYNLATDAAPDEIRLILRAGGFTEVKPPGKKPLSSKYAKLPEGGAKNNVFWVDKSDRGGKEYGVKARVNGDIFDIETLRKDSKDKTEFGSLPDDAARRDFTVNAMYIPLTSAKGANSKLIDYFGGAHHLKDGQVRFIGDPKQRLDGDENAQLRALRLARFAAALGGEVSEDYKSAVKEMSDLPQVAPDKLREELLKGLDSQDVDNHKYIKLLDEMGLLKTIFPKLSLDADVPQDRKDKRLAIAYLLRNNRPEDVKGMFANAGWSKDGYPSPEVNDILHLIKLKGWADKKGKDDDGFYDDFYDVRSGLQKTSLVPSVIKHWARMSGIGDDVAHHYSAHDLSHKAYGRDSLGNRVINKRLTDLYGRPPQGREFEQGIRHLENNDFKDRFGKGD